MGAGKQKCHIIVCYNVVSTKAFIMCLLVFPGLMSTLYLKETNAYQVDAQKPST